MNQDTIDISPKEYVSVLDVLRKIDFFSGVEEDNLKNVLLSLQKMSCGPKKTIIFQGEIANQLYILRQGKVVITTKNKGNKITLAELAPPMYFGEISLLRPMSATATVTTGDEGAELLILSHDALTQITKRIPDIKDRIQTIIDARLASKKKAKEADEA